MLAELVAAAEALAAGNSGDGNESLAAAIEKSPRMRALLPKTVNYLAGWKQVGDSSKRKYQNFTRRRPPSAYLTAQSAPPPAPVPIGPPGLCAQLTVDAQKINSVCEARVPGLYFVADTGSFMLQIEGGIRLAGNLCKIGAPCRSRVCCDPACLREISGCDAFHSPKMFGGVRDVRGLDVPRGRAPPRWLPSVENVADAVARHERADEAEALAMHAVLVAALHKKYSRGVSSRFGTTPPSAPPDSRHPPERA